MFTNIQNEQEQTMANTSLSLGEHWENFIKKQIANGRYGSASEVVRDALRDMEVRETKLEALREHLKEGFRQSEQGIYAEDFSFEQMLEDLDKEDS
jgi:antitoxin ParD1/3/4